MNGVTAANIQIYTTGDSSTLAATQKVRDYIDQADTPAGINVAYWGDRSEVLQARLGLMLRNGLQGGLLVVVLLSLFLRLLWRCGLGWVFLWHSWARWR